MGRNQRSKQLPYLTEYIEYALDWRPNAWYKGIPASTFALGAGISAAVSGLGMLIGRTGWDGTIFLSGAIGTFCIYMLGVFGISQTRRSKEEDPQLELRKEAKQVARRLEASVGKKRLHRDLSTEVATLLEEAARNWHRARSALDSPYWKSAILPAHLRSVRDQSLLAIDQGMQEMLVLFATAVPAKPGNWSFGELIDEVAGQDIFATRGRVEHISPYYPQGRGVAAKLMELADQVESVSRQLAGQELITGAPAPGSALEATLIELRQLKQAEEELRQDVKG